MKSLESSPHMYEYEAVLNGDIRTSICGVDEEDAKNKLVEWLDRHGNFKDYTIKSFSYKGRAW